MTFLEKFKQEHPDFAILSDGAPESCPSHFNYEVYGSQNPCHCDNPPTNWRSCADCWNREVPEEVKSDE